MNKRILSLIVCFALAICSMPLDRVRAQENNSTITVLSYTREIDTSKVRNGRQHGMYEALTTDSMHLAYSYDGVTYEALNYNTGVLFAKNEALLTKCLLQPYIFRMKDNSFGVVAIRINEGESRSDAVGQIIFFTSDY